MDKPSENTAASLRPFFQPKTVAVIGASNDSRSIGHQLVEVIRKGGFTGTLYPVNPHAAYISGQRAFPTVGELPEPIDLAIVVVPAAAALGVVEDCARHGVAALLVITSGFAELGAEGRQAQQHMLDCVRQHGMRLIGPNCLGLLASAVHLNALFVSVFPPRGRVAMSSDSGALGLALLAAARRLNIGISSFVSVGNRADVSSNDLLEYWEQDADTAIVLLYLESFGNPRRFARIARRVSQRKPIVAVKAGRTQAGQRAAGSHTAALAARDVAVAALFHQTGIIRAETLEEMFDLVSALTSQPLPSGRRVGVVTNAGGPGILCTDACEAAGLKVPELSVVTRAQLAAFLPPTASLTNPVDLIASATPEQFRQTIHLLLTSGEVDAVVVIYVPTGLADDKDVARKISAAMVDVRCAGVTDRPLLGCWLGGETIRFLTVFENEKIPCFPFPEQPARVLGKLASYGAWRQRPAGHMPEFADTDYPHIRRLCQAVLEQRGEDWLTTTETRQVLEAAGLPLCPGGVANSAEEAAALARQLGFPVAVKVASRRLIHKTDIGGVSLNLTDEQAVRQACLAMRQRLTPQQQETLEGFLVQPMISGGTEVMVGLTRDAIFGPLLAFGLGGIHVEVLGDVSFGVPPLSDADAADLVRSIRGHRLFEGYRGHPPADLPALENLLLRVSRLAEEVPEIREMDLNPLMALPPGQGCRIVDARLRVGNM